MLEDFLKLFGIDLKKRIEETPGTLVLDIKHSRIDWEAGELRVPMRIDFPDKKGN